MYLAETNEAPSSFEQFCMSMEQSPKVRSEIVREAKQQLESEQALQSAQTTNTPTGESDNPNEPCPIGEVVAQLIIEGGMNPDYVHYQMGLWELPLYLKALERKRSETMERERLWCYLGLAPHIDHKKIKSPRDLLPLPHELSREEAERAEDERIQDLLYSSVFGR